MVKMRSQLLNIAAENTTSLKTQSIFFLFSFNVSFLESTGKVL